MFWSQETHVEETLEEKICPHGEPPSMLRNDTVRCFGELRGGQGGCKGYIFNAKCAVPVMLNAPSQTGVCNGKNLTDGYVCDGYFTDGECYGRKIGGKCKLGEEPPWCKGEVLQNKTCVGWVNRKKEGRCEGKRTGGKCKGKEVPAWCQGASRAHNGTNNGTCNGTQHPDGRCEAQLVNGTCPGTMIPPFCDGERKDDGKCIGTMNEDGKCEGW